jgi:predicted transcriptional regulator of viral defense system
VTTSIPAISAVQQLLQRIEGEYHEMPGLSVTVRQAERLWGLDHTTCSLVLGILVERGTLKRTPNGNYLHS